MFPKVETYTHIERNVSVRETEKEEQKLGKNINLEKNFVIE